MLIDLGVKRIITKFESSSPEIFAKEKKCGIAYNDFIDHIRGLIAFGFEVGTGNIIGLPGQGVGDIWCKSDPHNLSFFSLYKEKKSRNGRQKTLTCALCMVY